MPAIFIVAAALALLFALVALVVIRRACRLALLRLEMRLARAERLAAGDAVERLRTLRRRVGVLYFDGLPMARSRELRDAFADGVRHAARDQWERAAESWEGATKHATDGELTALFFLTGACRLAAGRLDSAKQFLETASESARRNRDRHGTAAVVTALAILARDEQRPADALAGFARAVGLWRELGELREVVTALRLEAELLEGRGDLEAALARYREAMRQAELAGDTPVAVRHHGAACRVLVRLGDLDAARSVCEDGLLLARKAGDRDGEVELLVSVGEILLRQRNHKRALEVLERALRHNTGGRKRISEARILAGLAEASEGMARADVASEYYERALAKAEAEQQESLQAVCLAGLARGARHHGALDKACSLLARAVELDRAAEAEAQLGLHLSERAVLALEMHDPAGAARDLDEAGRCADSAGDRALGFHVELVQARMAAEDGRVAEAQKRLEQLAEPTGNPELAADFHFESGHIARARGERDKALASWRLAVEHYGRVGAIEAQARARMFLAEVLAEVGQIEAAVSAAGEALRFLSRSGTRKDEIRALRAAAFVDAARGRTRDAHMTLDRAVELARKTKDRWSEAASLLALGRLAREVGVYDAARDNLTAARRLFSELGSASRVIEIDREVGGLPLADVGVQFLGRED